MRSDDRIHTEWTPETDAELTRLWNQTDPVLTTVEIGARLGVSKNSAVGRAHRISLPSRPSPIRRYGPRPDSQKMKFGRPKSARVTATGGGEPMQKPVLPKAEPFVPDPALTISISSSRSRCAFPLWAHDAKPDHRFCGHPTIPGSPYCRAHTALCSDGKPPAGGAAAYFSKINDQSGSPYGAQDMGPVKAKGEAA